MAAVFNRASFIFINGKQKYTVDYWPILKQWIIYHNDKNVSSFSIGRANPRINQDVARHHLDKYLQALPVRK